MPERSSESQLRELWEIEDRYTALAGSAVGMGLKAVRSTRESENIAPSFWYLPDKRKTLVKENLSLVMLIAKKYAKQGGSLKDLVHEGNIGLVTAAQKFDSSQGYKFSTYAVWWIRKAIVQFINKERPVICVPAQIVDTINNVKRVQDQLVQEYGRQPTEQEVAEELLVPLKRVRAVLKMAEQPISVQPSASRAPEGKYTPDTRQLAELSILKEKMKHVLETLTEREREVLEQRFGLIDGYSRTLQEVADQFRMSRDRIRQIEAKAFRRFRKTEKARA